MTQVCLLILLLKNEKETLMQRFLRLRCEVGELVEELDSMTESSRDLGTNEGLSIQVKSLERQLEACNFETAAYASNDGKGSSYEALRSQIDSLRAINPKEQDKRSGVYQVFVGGDRDKSEAVDLAKLDARLALLEKTLGQDSFIERNLLSSSTDNRDLASCIGILDGRKTFLNQQHVDHVEGRLSALNFKMNSISEQRSAIEAANKDDKLNRLSSLVSGQSSLAVTLLPELIERLEAVSELEDRSKTWSDLVINIEQQQRESQEVLKDSSCSVKNTRDFIEENIENILKKSQDLQSKVDILQN